MDTLLEIKVTIQRYLNHLYFGRYGDLLYKDRKFEFIPKLCTYNLHDIFIESSLYYPNDNNIKLKNINC